MKIAFSTFYSDVSFNQFSYFNIQDHLALVFKNLKKAFVEEMKKKILDAKHNKVYSGNNYQGTQVSS